MASVSHDPYSFVDILKLFVVSTKAGYELETPPSKMVQLVNDCPNQSGGRPLMTEEIALRTSWIHTIYLTLEYVQWKKLKPTWKVDRDIQTTYKPVLESLVQSKEMGEKLATDQLLHDYFPSLVAAENSNADTMIERAIVAQTLRVIWITLEALQEEELAKPRTPRPKIPGAFDD